ncbi:cytochrome P450 CYP749A22-like [Euphorbia lathyris]|uniref:cytochrome P450 CYP749A22-like n=1 Tax=Euphorbia lathyris TaxID=212925 RepID=UPI003314332E
MIIYVSSCAVVCLMILWYAVKMLKKVWWNPIRIQSMMRSQGIKGPSYKFFHGNSKQIMSMGMNAKKNPIQLSHHQVLPAVLPHIYAWNKLYGTNFLSWHGTQAYLTVTEPELIKEILNDRDGNFPKQEADPYVKKLLGDGIITTCGDKWFKLRKLSNHAFHSDSLKGMVPAMIASVEMMFERWRKHQGKEIDVFQEFKVLTSEAISRTAFGSSYLEGQHIFHMLTRLAVIISRNRYNIRLPIIQKLVKTEDDIESDRMEQEIRKSVMNMIKKREVKGQNSDNFGKDFLGLLVKAHHDTDHSKKISVDDLIDECKSFYVAGQETTASSLTWTAFLLAIHTDWQDKAREEVLQLFGSNINPSFESLTKLKIMNMIINEALRLYPPSVVLPGRNVKREVRLGNLIVPANVKMEIPILAFHHDPKIWGEDVHVFKPERFAEGIAKATNNNVAAYLPFGLGARSCVGSNFAITETKIVLSMILQRYRFVLSPTYVHSPFHLLTMCPQHGLQILLHPL